MKCFLVEAQHETGAYPFSIGVPREEYLEQEIIRYLQLRGVDTTNWKILQEITDVHIVPSVNEQERQLLQGMIAAQEQNEFHETKCCTCKLGPSGRVVL